jgi:hypothetical protein
VALTGLLAVGVPLVVVAIVAGGGGSGEGSPLRIELTPLGPDQADLVVYIDDDSINTLETSNGHNLLDLECRDRKGKVLVRGTVPWPFTNTDGGTYSAHAHQTVPSKRAGRLKRCRLPQTDGPLEGPVGTAR